MQARRTQAQAETWVGGYATNRWLRAEPLIGPALVINWWSVARALSWIFCVRRLAPGRLAARMSSVTILGCGCQLTGATFRGLPDVAGD